MSNQKPSIDPWMKNRSRRLRRDSTMPERILWCMLRDRRLNGLKIRRQHVIGPYVVDYYCHEANLVVELDGVSHVGKGESDDDRDRDLKSRGHGVVRVTNDDVLDDRDAVRESIAAAVGMPG